ncbi:MAG TPA: hypothetical protein VN922_02390, partial [Bacteroidia bacterium]|nr:hypothetical protein [Bacteroidia bacterium]
MMNYEEIESSFERLLKEGFEPFFKKRDFKCKGTKYTRQCDDLTQVFYVSKLLKKNKTGYKNMVIQPQFCFFNVDISQIIWPGEKNRLVAKIGNGFLDYDMGVFSGKTFYSINENDTD